HASTPTSAYTLSLLDPLPIFIAQLIHTSMGPNVRSVSSATRLCTAASATSPAQINGLPPAAVISSAVCFSRSTPRATSVIRAPRPEEHTTEPQSIRHLVCRPL